MKKWFLIFLLFSFNCLAEDRADYLNWLEGLKREMVEKGISPAVINKVYEQDYFKLTPDAVQKDRKQSEFVFSSSQYLQKIITKHRVEKAQKEFVLKKDLLKKITKKYGVPGEYLIAFWSVESNFGTYKGGFMIVEALTHLSYDKRRSAFFKKELFNALKIIEDQELDYKNFKGSWAGALGHFQFMPTTFNSYAVDFDGDERIDIINSFADAAASASNYLSQLGWKEGEPWGQEVTLAWNFDYAQSGRSTKKKVSDWKRLGVKTTLNDDFEGSLIVPEGYKGRAYLVLSNFQKIMIWNRSENYALAISLLSDYIKNNSPWREIVFVEAIKTSEIEELQRFINQQNIDNVELDGQLGSKTRISIQKLQTKLKLPADGYPSYLLKLKIERFDAKKGFELYPPLYNLR